MSSELPARAAGTAAPVNPWLLLTASSVGAFKLRGVHRGDPQIEDHARGSLQNNVLVDSAASGRYRVWGICSGGAVVSFAIAPVWPAAEPQLATPNDRTPA